MSKYLLLDEAFNGLDTVMKNVLKRLIAENILDSGMTTIKTFLNLLEFESRCDNKAMIHNCKLLIKKNLRNDKLINYNSHCNTYRPSN